MPQICEHTFPGYDGRRSAVAIEGKGLTWHQPEWEGIVFCLMDQPEPPHGLCRSGYARLTYDLGCLHSKDVEGVELSKEAAEDVCWSIRQPHRIFPLWEHHRRLSNYLQCYDSDGEFGNHGQSLQDFSIPQSEESANNRNCGQFYLNMELAVDYIGTVVSKGLNLALYPSGRHGKLDVNNPEQNILHQARKSGNRLLWLRDLHKRNPVPAANESAVAEQLWHSSLLV